jgi:general secretion pathway protein M
MTPPLHTRLQPLHQAWQQRPLRERRLLLVLALVLAGVSLWQMAVAPAWATWRQAPARQAELEAQTRQMRQWQAEVQQLQVPVRIGRSAAIEQVQLAAEALLGPGVKWQPQGELLLVTLQAAPAQGLTQWLSLAREKAQVLPQQVQLQRAAPSGKDTAKDNTDPLWQGRLTLRLP